MSGWGSPCSGIPVNAWSEASRSSSSTTARGRTWPRCRRRLAAAVRLAEVVEPVPPLLLARMEAAAA